MFNKREIIEFYNNCAERRFEKRGNIEDVDSKYITVLDYFIENLSQEPNVLDCGCGVGRDFDYLKRKGVNYFGIDISKEQLEYAGKSKFIQMDMSKLGFKDRVFDGIWCPNSIFFQTKENAEETLHEFERCLRYGGKCAVGFKIGEKEEIDEMNRQGEYMEYLQYTERSAMELFDETSFSVYNTTKNNVGDYVFFTVFAERE